MAEPEQIIEPKRLVAGLLEAGWLKVGSRRGEYVRLQWGDQTQLLVPFDQAAPEFKQMMLACLWTLERLADAGRAADRALTLALCSCGGRRWSEDENWSPQDYELGIRREPGRGLIPCGFCNEGGWTVEPVEPA